jgi:hypothetical protein
LKGNIMLASPVRKILIGLAAVGIGFIVGRLGLAAANSPRHAPVIEAVATADPASLDPAAPSVASPAQAPTSTVAAPATPAPVAVASPASTTAPDSSTPVAQVPVTQSATASAPGPKRRVVNGRALKEMRFHVAESGISATLDGDRVHLHTPLGEFSFDW